LNNHHTTAGADHHDPHESQDTMLERLSDLIQTIGTLDRFHDVKRVCASAAVLAGELKLSLKAAAPVASEPPRALSGGEVWRAIDTGLPSLSQLNCPAVSALSKRDKELFARAVIEADRAAQGGCLKQTAETASHHPCVGVPSSGDNPNTAAAALCASLVGNPEFAAALAVYAQNHGKSGERAALFEVAETAAETAVDAGLASNSDLQAMRLLLGSMRSALHTNMLRAFPNKSHEEITTEIGRALGIIDLGTVPRNFCPACGKRVGSPDSIHTCTPPIASHSEK
jgi:hypothetical protein